MERLVLGLHMSRLDLPQFRYELKACKVNRNGVQRRAFPGPDWAVVMKAATRERRWRFFNGFNSRSELGTRMKRKSWG